MQDSGRAAPGSTSVPTAASGAAVIVLHFAPRGLPPARRPCPPTPGQTAAPVPGPWCQAVLAVAGCEARAACAAPAARMPSLRTVHQRQDREIIHAAQGLGHAEGGVSSARRARDAAARATPAPSSRLPTARLPREAAIMPGSMSARAAPEVPPSPASSCHRGGACRLDHTAALRVSTASSHSPGPGGRGLQNSARHSAALQAGEQREMGRDGRRQAS